MADWIIVPVARRLDVRSALLRQLAESLGLPVATGGYVGMAAWSDPASNALAAPGLGETLRATEDRVSANGLFVGFRVDDADGIPITLRHPAGAAVAMSPKAHAATTLHGAPIPAVTDVDEATYFEAPPDLGLLL